MALTATRVTAGGLDQSLPFGSLHAEVWRFTATGTPAAGDNITIKPTRGRFVISAVGGQVANISAAKDTVTIVTRTALTLNDTFDVLVLVQA